ncbi:MAG: zinc-binding dehydrogenase [Chloroflexi bacterium RBG_16_57_8]|nr:MAG: zinc-binding dehydrogenase [Chloroflexi bacterium RBG_16_57_8]
MKAAVCYEFGKPLVVEELDIDKPHTGEVKVRMAATAICHSDIHFMAGDLGGKLPFVPGHESAGYVEEVGETVTSVKPGDPVVVSLLRSCGRCVYCKTGRPNMCEAKWPLDTESRLRNKKGAAVAHGVRVASFAQYVVVDQSQVVKIPGDMPMDRACLLACGVITGFGAVVNRAKVKPLSSVVVIGVGGVGLNSIQGAAFCGAYPVIAVDMLDVKLKAARDFGATHTVNGSVVGDAVQVVKDLTGGRGADYVFVTVGATAAVRQGLSMLARQGMAVIVGLATENLTSNPMEYIDGEKVLTGSFMGTTNLSVDVPKMVDLYKAGRLKLDELITARYPLDQINEAIDAVKKGQALRNVIVF